MLNEDNKNGDINTNAVPSSYIMALHLEGKTGQKYIKSYCDGFFFPLKHLTFPDHHKLDVEHLHCGLMSV